MSNWKSFLINDNQIVAWTNKAVLIKMPKTSKYRGYEFWHPSKLVRISGKQYAIRFNDNFTFRLKKNGNVKNITAGEIEDIFPIEQPLLHIPPKLEPEHTRIDESLIDDE